MNAHTTETAAASPLTRTMDPEFLNRVANLPDVRPMLGGEGELDLAPIISDASNFCFANHVGGYLVLLRQPGMYEVHTIAPRGGESARLMLATARAARDFMFAATPCLELITRAPNTNPGAKKLAEAAGFRSYGVHHQLEVGVDAEVLNMTVDDWIGRAPCTKAEGRSFHALIEAARPGNHADDEQHDRCVGAALLMAKAGNVQKGVAVYSRLATLLGYGPVGLLSVTPPVVDIGTAVISLNHGCVEVLLCR